jgi:uncharacterized membrane protein
MKINYVALYAIALAAFVAIDGLWLGFIAKNLYAKELKGLLTNDVKWAGAILFYLLFLGFVIFFVLQPALQGGSLQTAAIRGALFGFATYMTYDLTNYATIKGFPLRIVIIDLIWGTFLTAAISSIAYTVYTKLF